uniref:Metallophosphoesterase n=1 Tax=Rhodopseudomonas palustris (strain BisA53) TaxID=316055 RepID=Q07SP8_RHOP5
MRFFHSKSKLSNPRLPDGYRLYAVGDIHGCATLLQRAFDSIDEDLSRAGSLTVIEVYLGDYIDRGPDSRRVLDLLISRRKERQVVCIKGNHEAFALNALVDWRKAPTWLRFGGLATLRSYNIQLEFECSEDQIRLALDAFARIAPPEHLSFIHSLIPLFECGDYCFVHAGVNPRLPLSQQVETDLLSIRTSFLQARRQYEKYIVHGHTPVREPEVLPNRINIDTGAYSTGRLTLLTLEEDTKHLTSIRMP